MSWYTSGTIGVMTVDGKIYPVGPFDKNGKIVDVFCTSRSFTPEEWNNYKKSINEDNKTDEFKRIMEGRENFSCVYLDELPTESPLKKGYFLADEVASYEKDNIAEFSEYLTPEEYLYKLQAEIALGAPAKKTDSEGYEYTEHSVRDYRPYAYIDTDSIEYYANKVRSVANMYYTDGIYSLEKEYGKGAKVVIIIDEG